MLMKRKGKTFPKFLPILPVIDDVLFPKMVLPLMIKDEEYLRMVETVMEKETFLVVAKKKSEKGVRKRKSGYVEKIGTVARVLKITKTAEGTMTCDSDSLLTRLRRKKESSLPAV